MVFVEKRGKPLRVVNDQVVTPTSSAELGLRIGELIHTQHYGLYHLTNEGQCTWFEFASTIFSLTGKRPAPAFLFCLGEQESKRDRID
jgi:dTDP-4-dehydrorhamnose reductase